MFGWNQEDYEKKKLIDIEYAKGVYDSQIQKVKEAEYLKQLVFKDYVDKIKQHTSRYDLFNHTFFTDACSEIGKKLKKERPNLETLTRLLLEDFLGNDSKFKIKDVISCGLENYGWKINLNGNDKTIAIIIPIMCNIDTENAEYAYYGKFGFMVQTSECGWEILKLSYKMEDIANSIKDYFQNN